MIGPDLSGGPRGPTKVCRHSAKNLQTAASLLSKQLDVGPDGTHSSWAHHHWGRPWILCPMWGSDQWSGLPYGLTKAVNQNPFFLFNHASWFWSGWMVGQTGPNLHGSSTTKGIPLKIILNILFILIMWEHKYYKITKIKHKNIIKYSNPYSGTRYYSRYDNNHRSKNLQLSMDNGWY